MGASRLAHLCTLSYPVCAGDASPESIQPVRPPASALRSARASGDAHARVRARRPQVPRRVRAEAAL